MSPSIMIIGEGISGLGAAIALKKACFQVQLYERTAELGHAGAGITLWANALKVLQQLGVADKIVAAGGERQQGMVSDQHGRYHQQLLAHWASRAIEKSSLILPTKYHHAPHTRANVN